METKDKTYGHYFIIKGKNRYLRLWDISDPNKTVTVDANSTEDDALVDAFGKFERRYKKAINHDN